MSESTIFWLVLPIGVALVAFNLWFWSRLAYLLVIEISNYILGDKQ